MGEKSKILIVEPDKLHAGYLKVMLERNGWSAKMAYSAREAMQSLLKEDFNLVMLNRLNMEIDGLDLVKWIRRQEKSKGIKLSIIGIAGYSYRTEHELFKKAGADLCVHKPLYQRDLLHSLAQVVA